MEGKPSTKIGNSLPHSIAKLNGGKRRIPMKPNIKKLAGIVFNSLFISVGFVAFGCSGTKATNAKGDPADSVKVVCCCCVDYDHKYILGRALFESRHYAEAIPVFEELLASNEVEKITWIIAIIGLANPIMA
jgi:hypothetical protein